MKNIYLFVYFFLFYDLVLLSDSISSLNSKFWEENRISDFTTYSLKADLHSIILSGVYQNDLIQYASYVLVFFLFIIIFYQLVKNKFNVYSISVGFLISCFICLAWIFNLIYKNKLNLIEINKITNIISFQFQDKEIKLNLDTIEGIVFFEKKSTSTLRSTNSKYEPKFRIAFQTHHLGLIEIYTSKKEEVVKKISEDFSKFLNKPILDSVKSRPEKMNQKFLLKSFDPIYMELSKSNSKIQVNFKRNSIFMKINVLICLIFICMGFFFYIPAYKNSYRAMQILGIIFVLIGMFTLYLGDKYHQKEIVFSNENIHLKSELPSIDVILKKEDISDYFYFEEKLIFILRNGNFQMNSLNPIDLIKNWESYQNSIKEYSVFSISDIDKISLMYLLDEWKLKEEP